MLDTFKNAFKLKTAYKVNGIIYSFKRIPLIKKMSHLPIIVDPSHAAGIRWMIEPLSKAAVAIGADGLIIEVHNNPDKAPFVRCFHIRRKNRRNQT